MTRTTTHRVSDILQAIARCERYAKVLAAVENDETMKLMAEDAIERNLQIIGEAVNHLPDELITRHPQVPWPQIRGFRNILVHQYFGVDGSVVLDVVENHLPTLSAALTSRT